MPIYEYTCPDCGKTFELLRAIREADERAVCPDCQSAAAKRIVSNFFSPGLNVGGGCSGCAGGNCQSCGH